MDKSGFNAYGLAAFTRLLGMSKEQAERLCEEAFNAITDRSQHTYSYLWVLLITWFLCMLMKGKATLPMERSQRGKTKRMRVRWILMGNSASRC